MKPLKQKRKLCIVFIAALLTGIAGVQPSAMAESVILNPGYLSGTVSVTGQQITQIDVRAIDTEKFYSASVMVSVPAGASSIPYNLTVEGDHDYYVIAEARIAGMTADITSVITEVHGPRSVPIGSTEPLDLSVDPAFISGTISTTTSGNIVESYVLYARYFVPEFNEYFDNKSFAYNLDVEGQPGVEYQMLVTPMLQYSMYSYIKINGIQYYNVVDIDPLPPGEVYSKNFSIDVTKATISGTAILDGSTTDVYNADVYGYAGSPFRYKASPINNLTHEYFLEVDAGNWFIYPRFYYYLTVPDTALNGLRGYLFAPATYSPTNAGDQLTKNFLIEPGYITGKLNFSGTTRDIYDGYIRFYSSTTGATSASWIRSGSMNEADNGRYMAVVSPGSWHSPYHLTLTFDYPDDPNISLKSYLYEYVNIFGPDMVVSGQTVISDETLGTATVRLFYQVAGGGQLRSPIIYATREGQPTRCAQGIGSNDETTKGEAIVTLFPGSYVIEAFATVEGSQTEFGTYPVTVEEGDSVVIGGINKPVIRVTSPTDGDTVAAYDVVVEGTSTAAKGIEGITINGVEVDVTSTGNPGDPNEVAFNHPVQLPNDGANTINVVATDTDGNSVTLALTVYREILATPTTLHYIGDTLIAANTPVTLAAILLDTNGDPIPGAEISLQVDSQPCSAVTDSDGRTSCQVSAIPDVGIYPITVSFAGDETNEGSQDDSFLVVYDPEGGFVTGGGWIMSPAGAYAPDPTLAGKANFGFVSKYKKGASVPVGNTEFQFKVADFNFHSDMYEWLVVAGARAQFKGNGMVNGTGDYGFLLTAVDGELPGGDGADRFRIKIWDRSNDSIIYDNQMGADEGSDPNTEIAGGSIVIHK